MKMISLREVIFTVKSAIDQFVEGLDEVHLATLSDIHASTFFSNNDSDVLLV